MMLIFKNQMKGGNGEIVIFTDAIQSQFQFLEELFLVVTDFIKYEEEDYQFNITGLAAAAMQTLCFMMNNPLKNKGFIVAGGINATYYNQLGALDPGITRFI